MWGGVTSNIPELTAAFKAAEPPIPREVRTGPRAELARRSYLLYEGVLRDALALTDVDNILLTGEEIPNLWWPQEVSWFVASGVGLDSTYVGGSVALIGRLCSDPRLEALAVLPSAEIT